MKHKKQAVEKFVTTHSTKSITRTVQSRNEEGFYIEEVHEAGNYLIFVFEKQLDEGDQE